jgi:GGDEF domain-containing protein
MADVNSDGLRTVLERVEKNVAAFNQEARFKWRLSISVGVAMSDPTRTVTLDGLIASADQAMYREKEQSRLAS